MSAPLAIQAYPAVRDLPDDVLCERTRLALCDDDEPLQLVQAVCSCCQAEFEYVQVGRNHARRRCDDCSTRNLHRTPLDQLKGRHGFSPRYVRCVCASEFYRVGNWYEYEMVRSDISNHLARQGDFDWGNIIKNFDPDRVWRLTQ